MGEKGDKGEVGSPGYEILNKEQVNPSRALSNQFSLIFFFLLQANALGYSITKDEILMLKVRKYDFFFRKL